MENKMLECFALFGLHDGDRIKLDNKIFIISEQGLLKDGMAYEDTTTFFLQGKYDYEVLPWEPKIGDAYFCIIYDGNPWVANWINGWDDRERLYVGNVARTEEEILEKKPELAKKLGIKETSHEAM